ncbi:uncharacterized protein LOC143657668 isoform X3 [Tamandua tetradactyla]|uniref:uncharacterized protein LOC143657668 isoform X3 n=1 Tax=Tamandua tetradactyla TaxID=48850 RepID=UPI004053DBB8
MGRGPCRLGMEVGGHSLSEMAPAGARKGRASCLRQLDAAGPRLSALAARGSPGAEGSPGADTPDSPSPAAPGSGVAPSHPIPPSSQSGSFKWFGSIATSQSTGSGPRGPRERGGQRLLLD